MKANITGETGEEGGGPLIFWENYFEGVTLGCDKIYNVLLFSDFLAFFGNKLKKNVFNHYEKDNIRKTNTEISKMCLKCSEFLVL